MENKCSVLIANTKPNRTRGFNCKR